MAHRSSGFGNGGLYYPGLGLRGFRACMHALRRFEPDLPGFVVFSNGQRSTVNDTFDLIDLLRMHVGNSVCM